MPHVYSLLRQSPDVLALVGDRIYRHGSAPLGVQAPYITWFVLSGTPENELSDRPKIDNYTVQVDCWSDNDGTGDAGIETLALAVRDAIEARYHITSVPVDDQDFDTQRYRVSFIFTVWDHRPMLSS